MLVDIWNYLHLDVHHYMELLELKGQLVRADGVNGEAANDNLAHANPCSGLPCGGSEALA